MMCVIYNALNDRRQKNLGTLDTVPLEDIEKAYWKMVHICVTNICYYDNTHDTFILSSHKPQVETGLPELVVEYGNDIDAAQFGSGFPV